MAYLARATTTADGITTDYSVPFPYLEQKHVNVTLRDDANDATPTLMVQGTDYTFTSAGVIRFASAPAAGLLVDRIRSSNPLSPIVPWGGGTLTNHELATNNLQLLYLIQEADDLAVIGTGGALIIDQGEAPGASVAFLKYSKDWLNNGTAMASGLAIDNLGQVTDTGSREVWIDWFYTDDTTTDTQALLNFAEVFNANFYGFNDVVLKFAAGRGRGPSGRYLIDSEIQFTAFNYLELDFGAATLRFTAPTSRIRYSPPVGPLSSSITLTNCFVVRNVKAQYSAAIDSCFFWDIDYNPSRAGTTGWAENVFIYPQDTNNPAMTCTGGFRTKNTWQFTATNCHYHGPARISGVTQLNQSFIVQDGLCVVLNLDNCRAENCDSAIVPGTAALVGVEGTFSGGASFSRGKVVRQGSNLAYFGRNDGVGGSTYSLYDETGTLVTGAADVLDSTGLVTGSFNITSINRYQQVSEAISVKGGSVFIACNYLINRTSPNASTKFLEWMLVDCHVAYDKGIIKADGVAVLGVGSACFFIANKANTNAFELTNIDNLSISGPQATTNDLAGCTYLKARSVTGGMMMANSLYFFQYAGDFDNTVKDFKVHGNSAYGGVTVNNPAPCTFLNTGKRLNKTNTRGIDFKSNGALGWGFDLDDNRAIAWVPALSSDGGTVTYTDAGTGKISLQNGVLTYSAKINVTAVSSPTGNMYITFPSLLSSFGIVDTQLPDQHMAVVRAGSWLAPATFIQGTRRFQVTDLDPTTSPVSAWNGAAATLNTPFSIFISGQCPVEYD